MPATLYLYPADDTVGSLRAFYAKLQTCRVDESTAFNDGPPALNLTTVASLAHWLKTNHALPGDHTIPFLDDLSIAFSIAEIDPVFGGTPNDFLVTVRPHHER